MSRPVIIIAIFVLVANVVGLFHVKHKVQNLKKDLVEINRQLMSDREVIHVLNAEWTYLNSPNRIRKLADKYLGMEFAVASQLKEYAEVKTAYMPSKSSIHATNYVQPTLRPVVSSYGF